MYETPCFNENNEKILCEMNGKNSEMLMNIYVKKMQHGESVSFCEKENETALLLLSGEVTFEFDGKSEKAHRKNVFEEKPYCLHFSKNKQVKVIALTETEILVQQTDNEKEFDTVFYTPDKCIYQEFGSKQWDGTAHRQVTTVFDLSNAPYSNLVCGEVFHKPGCWSSYPPHHHPQPELYYYQFDKPQGFGVGFVGENCYKLFDGGALSITPNNSHQQVAAPGYRMYYAWLIRHLDNDPWDKTRITDKEHEWLLDL